MTRFTGWAAAVVVGLATAAPAGAATVLFGTIGAGGNAFPFSGTFDDPGGTRYQQVYDDAKFGATGPIDITAITFFNTSGSGDFRTATYDFFLSTSNFPVNALDTVDLNNNPGPDQTLVGSFALTGPVGPGPITFTLTTPFTYDPADGDLLLDIHVSGATDNPFNAFLDAMNGDFGTDSSRAHDFGTGFEMFGLVTEFEFTPAGPVVPAPPAVLLGLVGAGVAGLARRRFARA
jgi:hypothetical protein